MTDAFIYILCGMAVIWTICGVMMYIEERRELKKFYKKHGMDDE